jgi:hypothetical protein
MKKSKQNQESASVDEEYHLLEQEMDHLADVLCVKQKMRNESHEDPFTDYMDSLQAKFHSDPHHFKSRLAKGYQVLLQQLQAEGSSRTNPIQ